MELALDRQLSRFSQKDLRGSIRLGAKTYPLTQARVSLEIFKRLIAGYQGCLKSRQKSQCLTNFNTLFRESFDVYVPDLKPGDPRYGQDKDSFFTGYHTLTVTGSLDSRGPFVFPVYGRPHQNSDVMRTRSAIDFQGALQGKGLELFYGKDLLTLYLLHTEGSGYVRLTNKGVSRDFYVTFAGTNKRPWRWISTYMKDKGWITNTSVAAVRRFLEAHPERHEEIFSFCPGYVYFQLSDQPPLGCDQAVVTDNRTIATDKELYAFKGLLAFASSERPLDTGFYDLDQEDQSKIPFQTFSRFFLDQDTGGAIKGKGRADIYFGKDAYAQYAATYQAREGRLFFFMAR